MFIFIIYMPNKRSKPGLLNGALTFFYLSNLFSNRLLKHTLIYTVYIFLQVAKKHFNKGRKVRILYFLKQAFDKHESHIHTFETQFPLTC